MVDLSSSFSVNVKTRPGNPGQQSPGLPQYRFLWWSSTRMILHREGPTSKFGGSAWISHKSVSPIKSHCNKRQHCFLYIHVFCLHHIHTSSCSNLGHILYNKNLRYLFHLPLPEGRFRLFALNFPSAYCPRAPPINARSSWSGCVLSRGITRENYDMIYWGYLPTTTHQHGEISQKLLRCELGNMSNKTAKYPWNWTKKTWWKLRIPGIGKTECLREAPRTQWGSKYL